MCRNMHRGDDFGCLAPRLDTLGISLHTVDQIFNQPLGLAAQSYKRSVDYIGVLPHVECSGSESKTSNQVSQGCDFDT